MANLVLRRFTILLCTLLVPGCSDTVVASRSVPAPSSLVGQWIGPRNPVHAHGWHQRELTLGADGRFTATDRSHGLYEGQALDAPSAWTGVEGTYRVEGDHVFFDPEWLTWWDHYETPHSRVARRSRYPWGVFFQDARYIAEGRSLTIRFNLYPADAPVPVSAEYVRRD